VAEQHGSSGRGHRVSACSVVQATHRSRRYRPCLKGGRAPEAAPAPQLGPGGPQTRWRSRNLAATPGGGEGGPTRGGGGVKAVIDGGVRRQGLRRCGRGRSRSGGSQPGAPAASSGASSKSAHLPAPALLCHQHVLCPHVPVQEATGVDGAQGLLGGQGGGCGAVSAGGGQRRGRSTPGAVNAGGGQRRGRAALRARRGPFSSAKASQSWIGALGPKSERKPRGLGTCANQTPAPQRRCRHGLCGSGARPPR
jgi:hypothetical protein